MDMKGWGQVKNVDCKAGGAANIVSLLSLEAAIRQRSSQARWDCTCIASSAAVSAAWVCLSWKLPRWNSSATSASTLSATGCPFCLAASPEFSLPAGRQASGGSQQPVWAHPCEVPKLMQPARSGTVP